MNEFLFLCSIPIFFIGFSKNRIDYKYYSVLFFSLMMHTVQIGIIFLAMIPSWLTLKIKNLPINKSSLLQLMKDSSFILFSISFLIVAYLDNIFYRLIKAKSPYEYALDLGLVTSTEKWSYLAFPKFNMIKFYANNYIPPEIIILSGLITVYILFFDKKNKFYFLVFVNMTLFTSILMYELGSRDVAGPRIYLFAEGLITFSCFSTLFLILNSYMHKKYTLFLITLFAICLNLKITPNFLDFLSLKYGEEIRNDPFRSTEVAPYRSDYATTYVFLKKHRKDDDMYISTMGINYAQYSKVPDYIINQNSKWNSGSMVDRNLNYIDPETGAVLINDISELKQIIKLNHNKKIFLLVNGGSVNIIYTRHLKNDFLNFIQENSDKIVFESSDGYGKVLLFNSD